MKDGTQGTYKQIASKLEQIEQSIGENEDHDEAPNSSESSMVKDDKNMDDGKNKDQGGGPGG